MNKLKNSVSQILCGFGFLLSCLGGCGLDSPDMLKPVVICVIGLSLMLFSIPFLERESE